MKNNNIILESNNKINENEVKNMNKIYARQVSYEQQESPLSIFEEYPEGIILDGNSDYKSHTTSEYDTIIQNIDNACDDMEDISNILSWYNTITEYFNDTFQPIHKDKYNTLDIHEWKEIIKEYQKYNSRE